MRPSRVALAIAVLLALAACPSSPPVISPCEPNPCGDNGVCGVVDGAAVCGCLAGFLDDGHGVCVAPGPCASGPCTQAHRSVCTAQGSTAVCSCDVGWVDDGHAGCAPSPVCTPNPCTGLHRGVCTAQGNTAVCGCDPGFHDDGAGACVAMAGCTPNPCTEAHRGACSTQGTTVVCGCDPGFRDDGQGACVPASSCTPNPCTALHRTACSLSGNLATCGCDTGYEDRGGTCVPTDPCAPNPCTAPHQGQCAATDGGSACSCDPGYVPGTNGCDALPPPQCSGQHATGDTYEPDECPTLAHDIASGVDQAHTLSPAGDVDFVRFSVDAGTIVRLAQVTAAVTTSLSLYAPDAVTVLETRTSPNPVLRKLAAAGTYYLGVRGSTASTTGATTLRYQDLGFDDCGDTVATARPVTVGTPTTGALEYPGDVEVLAVPVVAGHVYRFEETTALDVVVTLSSSMATLRGPQDEPEWITWKAATTGTLYFTVRAYNSSVTGPWAALFTDLGFDDQSDVQAGANTLLPSDAGTTLVGKVEYTGDVDVLAVPVLAGHIYRVEETSASDVVLTLSTATTTLAGPQDEPEWFQRKVAADDTLYVTVRLFSGSALGTWTLVVRDLGFDDQADTSAGATTVTPGTTATTVQGAAQFTGDVDVLAIPVQAGHVYLFQETSPTDVVLTLTNATTTLAGPQDEPEWFARKFAAADTVFLAVRLFSSSSLGTWTLSVTDLGLDDQADTAVGAQSLVPTVAGATLAGSFEYTGDVDVLAVPVAAGHAYRFEETSATDVVVSLSTDAGVLAGPQDQPEWFARLFPAAGTAYFAVRPFSSSTLGPWAMQVTDLGLDDHGDTAATATALTVGAAATPGVLQFSGDDDAFSFVAAPGALAFQVVTTGVGTSLTVQSAAGVAVTTGTGPGSITFSVPGAGTYVVHVRQASSTVLGAYTVRVSN